jgi:DNA repair exonuclease SbcCD ATPase subunit
LNEVNAAILQANNDANSKALEAKKPINAEIDKLEAEYRTLVNQIATLNDQIKQDNTRNRINADSREKLRAEFISERDTEKNVVDTCPACDQALPPEKVQAAIEKNNQIRAERLEKNMAEGRNLKSQFDEREKAIVDAQAKIDEISVKIPAIEKELQAQKNKLAKVYEPVNVDDLDREKDILESDMKAIRNGAMTRERDILAKIEQAQADMDAWKEKEAAFRAAEKSRARIEELEGQEKKLAAEYERLESELYLIEQFIVAKVGMLESQINSKFKLAKFTLFETQINGGIAECCHTTYKGVKFNHGLNSGARIQVGLDIINTLSDYYGFRAPIFIDNKESVTSLPDSDSQLISLVVDPAYKKLTVHQTEARKAS